MLDSRYKTYSFLTTIKEPLETTKQLSQLMALGVFKVAEIWHRVVIQAWTVFQEFGSFTGSNGNRGWQLHVFNLQLIIIAAVFDSILSVKAIFFPLKVKGFSILKGIRLDRTVVGPGDDFLRHLGQLLRWVIGVNGFYLLCLPKACSIM